MAPTVLVTGASGFVATHVVKAFLEAGYNVKGTVRSEASAATARQGKGLEAFGDKLSFAVVPDMAADGAFDQAVQGVDGVIHTASPFILNAQDYEKDLYRPAVNGTTSLLSSIAKHNPSVKRVVVTSSFASVLDPLLGQRPGYTYTEENWNPTSKEVASTDPVLAYLTSKTLAEQAAFDFVKNEKPNFTVSTLLPPMVYGPVIHHVKSMSSLNTSSADIYRLMNGTSETVPDTSFWAFADVRDLAKAHVLVYEAESAANQRYLVSSSAYSYQNVVDILRENFPQLADKTPKGDAGAALPPIYSLDTRKIQDLGLKFTPLKKTIVDTANSFFALEQQLA